ncbi:E3 ubiquitin/ISG15 ligase TRIM25-like [Aplochiton taeniatus]
MAGSLDSISCPICLDVMKDPVAIPCGHSYCMGCIKDFLDKDSQKTIRCPLCQEIFNSRPVLRKNTVLAELVEKLKQTELQAAPPALCYAGPGDVACDVCSGRKQKALKSCLVCLASYCETHLQPHYEATAFKKHKLVKASTQLKENVCSRHNKVLELFCVVDQKCICFLCTVDEHKGHETVSALEAKTGKREVAVQDSEMVFAELIRSIERRQSEVKELIRDQQKTVSQAKGLLKQLEKEIVELRRKDAELKEATYSGSHPVPPVNAVDILTPQPKTRADFLQYSCRLTLDQNTANQSLYLSERNRKVTNCLRAPSYPEHPDRFTNGQHVLCKEGLCGRHYWETERTGRWVSAAVAFKGINRTGSGADSEFGNNRTSWRLEGDFFSFRFKHNNVECKLTGPRSSRVGVYLDHRAGTLSFYSVSDTMTLLHSVHTTFTEPLYPAIKFGGWFGDTAEFCELD